MKRMPKVMITYINGEIEKFAPMDVDFINNKDLEDLLKGIARSMRCVNLLDLNNNLFKFLIYFDHPISHLIIPDSGNAVEITNFSSFNDGYESAENKAYKYCPPLG
ncbi:hypothetical protein PIB30_017020 [Stylosanthes scabra]|uniref:Uncharacterized protein n=1 Tax=Stylosanthes scabra TaxID=79078 RepID=A0ABU6Q7H3_9FABA|nr:hypothetical protein [Stylosanthes scabra]